MPRVTVTTPGLDRVRARIREMKQRTQSPLPVYQVAAETVRVLVDHSFEWSQPPFGGASWKPNAQWWADQKEEEGRSTQPLIYRGRLRANIVTRAEPKAVLYGISPTTPYGRKHQFGQDKIPARPFLPVDRRGKWVRAGAAKVVFDWLAKALAQFIRTGRFDAPPG